MAIHVRDEKFNITKEAGEIMGEIHKALFPIFEKSMKMGMTIEAFHYLVNSEADHMELLYMLERQPESTRRI